MDRGDLQRLSKEQLIELVLRLQRPEKDSRTSSKPPSTDKKVDRSDLRRSPASSRPRNPAAMVGRRHRSDDARAARTVLVDHLMGARTFGEVGAKPACCKLVSKAPSNLQRCNRRRAPRTLASGPFSQVPVLIRPDENAKVHIECAGERRLLRGLNGQSRG